jgi:hypothetical protein
LEKGVIFLQFVDVYLYETKNDTNPVKWQEIEVILDSSKVQTTDPHFEVEIHGDEEFERILSFNGEKISLKTIVLDDDEIPTGYLCYDIENWDFSGKLLIVPNPDDILIYSLSI